MFCVIFNVNKKYSENYNDWIVEMYNSGALPLFYKDLEFYSSPEWRKLRETVLNVYGRKCMKCGESEGSLHVDHIKPRSRYPELQLVFENMQVLCQKCNCSKGNRMIFDYRLLAEPLPC